MLFLLIFSANEVLVRSKAIGESVNHESRQRTVLMLYNLLCFNFVSNTFLLYNYNYFILFYYSDADILRKAKSPIVVNKC